MKNEKYQRKAAWRGNIMAAAGVIGGGVSANRRMVVSRRQYRRNGVAAAGENKNQRNIAACSHIAQRSSAPRRRWRDIAHALRRASRGCCRVRCASAFGANAPHRSRRRLRLATREKAVNNIGENVSASA
jgi:hypothetical protein